MRGGMRTNVCSITKVGVAAAIRSVATITLSTCHSLHSKVTVIEVFCNDASGFCVLVG